MQAGTLRHRLAIEAPVTEMDPYGEARKTWQAVGTVWGSIEPLRMLEYFEAQQTQAKATHRIEIRYTPAVTPQCRIVFNSRVFEVLAVLNPQERNEKLHLLVVEKP